MGQKCKHRTEHLQSPLFRQLLGWSPGAGVQGYEVGGWKTYHPLEMTWVGCLTSLCFSGFICKMSQCLSYTHLSVVGHSRLGCENHLKSRHGLQM